MNRKLTLATLGVASLLVSGTSAMAAPMLTFTETQITTGALAGYTRYQFFINLDNVDALTASVATDLNFRVLTPASSKIANFLQNGNEQGTGSIGVLNNFSQTAGTPNEVNDSYVYDFDPVSEAALFQTGNPGTNWFGNGVDANGAASGQFSSFSNQLTPELGQNRSWAFAVGSGATIPGNSNAIPLANIVAQGEIEFLGVVARNGVAYRVDGNTNPVTTPVGVSIAAGANAGTVVTGLGGNSYNPTVVGTFLPAVGSGAVNFSFAGSNSGDTLIALDLNLGTASIGQALGDLPAGITIFTGDNPFGAAYEVVLLADTTGSGPFTFNFNLGGGATANAIAVVPEPAALGFAAPALALLARRRRA